MAIEFKLPSLGENVHSGTVTRVLVAPGQTVAKDQGVIEVETDKAAVEVPSTVAGKVLAVNVRPGDKIAPGAVILTIEGGASAQPGTAIAPAAARPVAAAVASGASAPAAGLLPASGPIVAPPSVRRLARELGIDLSHVRPSAGSRLTADDLRAHQAGTVPAEVADDPALPDFSKWGPVERKPMSGVRLATARQMARAWSRVPHVTQHDRADITDLEGLRKKGLPGGGKVSLTAAAVKVVAGLLERFPLFAASVDMAAEVVVVRKYRHIGVAVDTERGLLVPVLRDADRKPLAQIAAELGELAARARDKKLSLDDMQGGVFTITNLGGIGGAHFSPIVNWPEVAILGVSRAATEAAWRRERWEPRLMLTFSLSYDHRVIDGADAARFLRGLVEAFETPAPLFEGGR